MTDVRVTRSMEARAWPGVIRRGSENSLAAWIASRWALPEQVRRASPQRDFLAPRRNGSWLALSTNVWRPSWRVNLAVSASGTWTNQTQQVEHRPAHFLTAAYRSATVVEWTSLLRASSTGWSFFPVTQLWNRVESSQRHAFTMHAHAPIQVLAPQNFATRMYLPVERHTSTTFRNSSGLALGERLKQRVEPWEKLRQLSQSWHGRGQTLTSQTLSFQTVIVHNQPERLSQSLSERATELRSVIREFRHAIPIHSPMLALAPAGVTGSGNASHSQLILQLRSAMEATLPRPSMQFAQASSSNQLDVLSAIRGVEKALSKVQSTPVNAPPAVPDMQRLAAQVYEQLERQIRIDRERRGH